MFGQSKNDSGQTAQDNNIPSLVSPPPNPVSPVSNPQQASPINGINLNEIPAVPVISNNPISSPAGSAPEVPTVDGSVPNADAKNDGDINLLLDLKQKALHDLSPLVDHLDQSPEEKFRTTMMMIQASDDKTLLPEAYKLAQAITNEKIKAQSLLDVINEINYFTQN